MQWTAQVVAVIIMSAAAGMPATAAAARILHDVDDPNPHAHHAPLRDVVVIVPDAPRVATLYHNSKRVMVPIESVWRPMCWGNAAAMKRADLLGIAAQSLREEVELARQQRAGDFDQHISLQRDDGGLAGAGFDLVFEVDGSVPGPALAALGRVEAFFESLFSDDITVVVKVRFADNLPGGVLGAANTTYTRISWNASRNALKNGMDANDKIQNFLPPGSTIPVRYNGASANITNENRVFWTLANFNATVGFLGGDAATLRFNENIAWDYDPDDGVIGFSFIDVVTHEVGHALGFASGVDFRVNDIEALDIFRFQRTDGAFNYNPDTYAHFLTTPRLASYNSPNNDVISDLKVAQYKMSDGFPNQASHFHHKSPAIGIMLPVLNSGQTFVPRFMNSADKRMLDAIGWDR